MLWTGVVLALVTIAWLLLTGISLLPALVVTGALGAQTSSGAVLWLLVARRRVRPPGPLEVFGVGFAIGSVLAMASGVLLGAVLPRGWGWILPFVATSVIWLAQRTRRTGSGPVDRQGQGSVAVGVALGALLGLAAALVNLERYPLEGVGTWSDYHPDMLFFEGLANSVALYGPSESIFMLGTDLRYHWFTYGWIGELTQSLGLAPFVGLTRVLPVAAVLAASAIAASWAARRSNESWVPALAAVLVAAGGYVGAAFGTLLNIDSPSQALTTVWVLALAYIAIEYLQGELGRRSLWLVGLLSVACVGGKASAAIVMVAALALAWAVASLRREEWRGRAAMLMLASALPSAVTYVVVLTGSASSGDLHVLTWLYRASTVQGLDLGTGALGIAAGTAILMIAILPRWAGMTGYWTDPAQRWQPASVVGMGLVVAALVPLALLSQGVNEVWFALCASAPLSVLSAIGLGMGWSAVARQPGASARGTRAALIVSALLGLVVLVVASLVWARGDSNTVGIRAAAPAIAIALALLAAVPVGQRLGAPGHRWVTWVIVASTILVTASSLARAATSVGRVGSQSSVSELSLALPPASSDAAVDPGVPVQPSGPDIWFVPRVGSGFPWGGDDGASWSALEVAAARYVVEHSSTADILVTDRMLSALVPALTARRTYLSAFPYQTLYGRPGAVEGIPIRGRQTLRFATAPTDADFQILCAAGVSLGWFTVVPGDPTVDWKPYAAVEFQNDAVTIVRLDRDLCGGGQ